MNGYTNVIKHQLIDSIWFFKREGEVKITFSKVR